VPLPSLSAAYLRAAGDFHDNPGRLAAYNSRRNCAVLAGPRQWQDEDPTVKLARVLAEDVRAPRSVPVNFPDGWKSSAFATLPIYSWAQSMAFCLRHLLIPYARLAGLGLPEPLTVATTEQTRVALNPAAERVLGQGQRPYKRDDVGRHRRVLLDREGPGWRSDPKLVHRR
jgi:ATP-dependent DNA helicase UvrD/PcrA